jgi:carbon-monoxide dehydrogenase medium subunit
MPKYCRPTTQAEALAALAAPGARCLVGGTDLLVGLRHHTVEPEVIVDLKAVTDLPDPIDITGHGVQIGPTLTLGALVAHPVIQEWYPALVEAALTVGSVAIRNRASLVGNACNASPAADTVPALLVHEASVTITSDAGDRTVPMSDFFLGPRQTQCQSGEIVTRLSMPRPPEVHGSAFRRLTRRRGVDLATVSVAAAINVSGRVVLGLGAVAPTPLRLELPGGIEPADEPSLTRVLDEQLQIATPISDVRGSREYRIATLRVLARRAVLAADDRRTRKGAS